MKKKILFIAPDYYGFNEVVFKGLKQYSNSVVRHIDSTSKYQYKNFGEKIYNFFSKTFLNRNIKNIKKGQHIKQIIEYYEYDTLIVNAPYTIDLQNLKLALKKSKHSIVLFWDSMEKIPQQKEFIDKFDTCFSFDKEDCEKYGLQPITNFYFVEKTTHQHTVDIAYLATNDDRMKNTIAILENFEKNNIRSKAKIFTYPSVPIRENLPQSIEVIHRIIPFTIAWQYYLDSKIILDIAHENQIGLSFRPFEAMGLSKKLITTNQDIINYDFYNPNNIFVIKNPNDFHIPKAFIENPYEELPKEIMQKYHIKNWVKTILSSYEN